MTGQAAGYGQDEDSGEGGPRPVVALSVSWETAGIFSRQSQDDETDGFSYGTDAGD